MRISGTSRISQALRLSDGIGILQVSSALLSFSSLFSLQISSFNFFSLLLSSAEDCNRGDESEKTKAFIRTRIAEIYLIELKKQGEKDRDDTWVFSSTCSNTDCFLFYADRSQLVTYVA